MKHKERKNYYHLLSLLLITIAIAASCGGGGGGDGGGAPSGGGGDTTAPSVVSITPADSATKVSMNTAIQIVFSEQLDAATVNSANVLLQNSNYFGLPVPCMLSYDDAARTITATPQNKLWSAKYSLTLSGLKDKAGNTMSTASFSFTTYKNSWVKRVRYNAGGISSYEARTLDANGLATRWVRYSGAGTDGNWFTDDDVVSYYYRYSFDANGNLTRFVIYTGAGTDTRWFTDDDVVSQYNDITYDSNGSETQVIYNSAGSDGRWFNNDDVMSGYSVYRRNGNRIELTDFNNPGPDGVWFNRDDTVSYFSADEEIDSNGQVIYYGITYDAGPDGIWITTDDVPTSYYSYTYDGQGRYTGTIQYNGAGVDGKWFTGDDVIKEYSTYAYDSNGNITRSVTYNGANVVLRYGDYYYDSNGNRTQVSSFNSAGADGNWFNYDDVLQQITLFSTDY